MSRLYATCHTRQPLGRVMITHTTHHTPHTGARTRTCCHINMHYQHLSHASAPLTYIRQHYLSHTYISTTSHIHTSALPLTYIRQHNLSHTSATLTTQKSDTRVCYSVAARALCVKANRHTSCQHLPRSPCSLCCFRVVAFQAQALCVFTKMLGSGAVCVYNNVRLRRCVCLQHVRLRHCACIQQC